MKAARLCHKIKKASDDVSLFRDVDVIYLDYNAFYCLFQMFYDSSGKI